MGKLGLKYGGNALDIATKMYPGWVVTDDLRKAEILQTSKS
jgi:hypothetical protein